MPNAECRMPKGTSLATDCDLAWILISQFEALEATCTMPPFDIRQRAFEFACAIVKLYLYLVQETKTPRRIADQLLGSGTAAGSNLEEAKAAHSHPDFVARISISLKESRETHYWLRLIAATALAPAERIEPQLRATN
ncbi:MAG: four helix bundle protein [Vicinamibacterales bacterium]